MPMRKAEAWQLFEPWKSLVVILAVIFSVETGVMLVLPYVPKATLGFVSEPLLDALLLTFVTAPVMWWLIVLPMRELLEARTQLLERIFCVREEEQSRIAKDLHDGIGQSLTGVLVALRAIEESSNDEELRSRIREVRRIGGDAHNEIRRIARALRPAVLDDIGLVAALERMVQDSSAASSARVTLDVAGLETDRLPKDVETALYRIAQEGLTNSLKHAGAEHIQLLLHGNPTGIEFEIRDDGRGFDPAVVFKNASGSHPFGLLSIQERVAMVGGTVQFISQPGSGTEIKVWIASTLGEIADVKN